MPALNRRSSAESRMKTGFAPGGNGARGFRLALWGAIALGGSLKNPALLEDVSLFRLAALGGLPVAQPVVFSLARGGQIHLPLVPDNQRGRTHDRPNAGGQVRA